MSEAGPGGTGNPEGVEPGAGTPEGGAWYAGFEPDDAGFVQTKGWKGPQDVIKSYRNLEKLTGVPPERIVKLPGDPEDEAWTEVYSKLGRPEKPDDYDLGDWKPGEDEIDLSGDYRQWAHELGLSGRQAKALFERYNGRMSEIVSEMQAQAEEQFKAEADQALGALKREWGKDYDANILAGKRAVQRFGVDEAKLDQLERAMGTRGFLEFFANVGRAMGEHQAAGLDGRSGFQDSPEAARVQIQELKLDPVFMDQYLTGNPEAVKKMTDLMKRAHPETP